jgi:hypothetical protein
MLVQELLCLHFLICPRRVTELLYNPMVRIQGDSRCSVNINYACFGESISSIQMITWNSLISETSYIDNIKPG